jgi:hypothetical protein
MKKKKEIKRAQFKLFMPEIMQMPVKNFYINNFKKTDNE